MNNSKKTKNIIEGKLIKKLPQEAGTSQAGKPWVKQICLVDNGEDFKNITAVQCFGEDNIKQMNKLREGDMVAISCNIYSEEWKGRYFNKIDGWWFVNQNEKSTDNRSEFMTSEDTPF